MNIKRVEKSVKEVLLNEWDPIGVKDNPNAKSEYDSYALKVVGMLYNGAAEDQIFEFLKNVVLHDFELSADENNLHLIAKKLMGLRSIL